MHIQSYSPQEWLNSPERRDMSRNLAISFGSVALPASKIARGLVRVFDRVDPDFQQKRLGSYGDPINILKTRTMPKETKDTTSSDGPNDNRASWFGNKLRNLGLDEAEQLRQVWRGELSFVGRRPIIYEEYEEMMDLLSPDYQKELKFVIKNTPAGIIDRYNADRYLNGNALDQVARAHSWIEDFYLASYERDLGIVKDCGKLLVNRTAGIFPLIPKIQSQPTIPTEAAHPASS